MMGRFQRVATFVVTCALLGGLATAGDLKKMTTAAEGRKRAAENGARSIKTRTPTDIDQIKSLYSAAVAAHNAWLDVTTAAISQGASTDAATATAAAAANSLVAWVAARNRALGEPVLEGTAATAVETQVRQGLADITAESVQDAKSADVKRKTAAASALSARLRWIAWDGL